jgi:hypothetical protein
MLLKHIVLLDLQLILPRDMINLLSHSLLGDVHVSLYELYRLFPRTRFHSPHFLLVGLGYAVQLPMEKLLVKFYYLWRHWYF